MSTEEKLAIVLFNLGGPENLDDVRPFLYNLFCDAEIIKLPLEAMRKPLAWFISTFRYKKSSGYYKKIGGGSPLRRITDEQGQALVKELSLRGIKATSYTAMRCWKPFTETVIENLEKDGINRVVALPLYPQFSISTTRSSFRHFIKVLESRGGLRQIRRHYIPAWYDHPKYIDALVETIEIAYKKLPNPDLQATHLIFSAHSVPENYLKQGEPYLKHTKKTVELVLEKLGNARPWTLSFQSKLGPVKWLEPLTDSVIRKLGKEGVKQILIVPVSFVSDHIETLYELDILYKETADEAGIAHFIRAPAFNTLPSFISALADIVEEKLNKVKALKS
ncbi:MAG: ferrochelatase [Acidobacteria bacterium]|nr:ferrochelatase [Acidobacteriota bacterium]